MRGWLNCNQVVLAGAREAVLVDSGYVSHSSETLRRLEGSEGLAGRALDWLVNTHCHSDHIGGNAAVIARYGCRVTIPRSEAPDVAEWSRHEHWNAYVDQEALAFRFDDTLAPGEGFHGGGLEWEAHAAPGHDMGALMFFEPRHRILVSGDALWENGLGFVWPHETPNPFVESAMDTLDRIERLDPRIVIPGHGAPFSDVAGALLRARSRLAAFGADPARTARHMMKVMFVFSVLHRGSIAAAEANAYVGRVPVYRDVNDRFVGAELATLGDTIGAELVRAGALRRECDRLLPTMAA